MIGRIVFLYGGFAIPAAVAILVDRRLRRR